MKRGLGFALVSAILTVGGLVTLAQTPQQQQRGGGDDRFGFGRRTVRFSASLRPSHEVPAVSSPAAAGEFRATLDPINDVLDYELSFSGLQANVLQAHIHIAQPNVNGGIVLWLCGTAANPGPAGTPTCPASGAITGQLRAANVTAVATQGIALGDFDEVIEAMRDGLAYANVHSVQSPGGEIRGQIQVRQNGRGDRDDDHN